MHGVECNVLGDGHSGAINPEIQSFLAAHDNNHMSAYRCHSSVDWLNYGWSWVLLGPGWLTEVQPTGSSLGLGMGWLLLLEMLWL